MSLLQPLLGSSVHRQCFPQTVLTPAICPRPRHLLRGSAVQSSTAISAQAGLTSFPAALADPFKLASAELQPKLSRSPAWQATPLAYRLGIATVLAPRDSFEAEAAVQQLLAACSNNPDEKVLSLGVVRVHYVARNRNLKSHGRFRRDAPHIPDSPYNLELQLATLSSARNPTVLILETALVNFVLPQPLVSLLASPEFTFVVGSGSSGSGGGSSSSSTEVGSGWGEGHAALLQMLQLRGESAALPPSVLDIVQLGVALGDQHEAPDDELVGFTSEEGHLLRSATEVLSISAAYEALTLQPPNGSTQQVAPLQQAAATAAAAAVEAAAARRSIAAITSSTSNSSDGGSNGSVGAPAASAVTPVHHAASVQAPPADSAIPSPALHSSTETGAVPGSVVARAATTEVEQMAFGWGKSNEGLVQHTTQQQFAAAMFLPLALQGGSNGVVDSERVELKCRMFLAMQRHTASAPLPTQFAMSLDMLTASLPNGSSSQEKVSSAVGSTPHIRTSSDSSSSGSTSSSSVSGVSEQTVRELLAELSPMFQLHSVPGSRTSMVRLADAFPLSMPASNMPSQFTRGVDGNTYGQTREKTDHKMEKKQRDQVRIHVNQQKAIHDPLALPSEVYQLTVAATEEIWGPDAYVEVECAAFVRLMGSLDRETGNCGTCMLPRIAIDEWCSQRAILHGRKHGLLYETQVAFLLKAQQDQLNTAFGESFMNLKRNITLKPDALAAMAARQQKMWW